MTPAAFLARLGGVCESGRGWMARCPAHEDRSPSLSIAEGDDGRVLLTCFAGCRVEAITAAVGLTVRDLFSESSRFSTRRASSTSKQGAPETPEALWAAIRLDSRRARREDLRFEGEIASGIFTLHERAKRIRRAITALGRDDERALDLLADAAALERVGPAAEAALGDLLALRQAADFPHPRQG